MKFLRHAIKFGVYLAMVLPLVFTSRTLFPWNFGKTVLFQMLVEILLVLALIYLIKNRQSLVKPNWLDILLGLFLFVQLVAAVVGVNFARSFWGNQNRVQGVFTWLHFGAFYFVLRNFFTIGKEWARLLLWVLAIGFVSAVVAWLGAVVPGWTNVVIIGTAGNLGGLVGNPIFFASYLMLPLFLSLVGFWLFGWGSKQKWILPAVGLLLAVTMFFTGARGSFVGLVLGAAVFWILCVLFSPSAKRKIVASAIGVVLALVLGGLYLFNQRSDYLQSHFSYLSRLLNISTTEFTADTRLMAWKIAVKGWAQKPLLGWGPENFQALFDKNYNKDFLKYSFAETVWDKPHNYFLETLSGTGVFGFALYVSIFVVAFVYLWRARPSVESGASRAPFFLLMAALAAYAAQMSFSFETSSSLLLFVSLLAYVNYLYAQSRLPAPEKGTVAPRPAKWLGPVLVVAILLAPYFLYVNGRLFKSSVLMGDSRDTAGLGHIYLWQKATPVALAYASPYQWENAIFAVKDMASLDVSKLLDRNSLEPVVPAAAAILEKEIKTRPDIYLPYFWLAQLYGFMGEYMDGSYFDKSNALLDTAAALSPGRQQIPALKVKNLLFQGKDKEAIAALRELVKENPDYPEPRWLLGIALIKDGQEDEGVKEAEAGMEFAKTVTGNVLYMIDLYAKRKEYKKIIPLYLWLVEKEPKNAASYYASIAATYAALKDKDQVVFYLRKAVELDPALLPEAREFLKQNKINVQL